MLWGRHSPDSNSKEVRPTPWDSLVGVSAERKWHDVMVRMERETAYRRRRKVRMRRRRAQVLLLLPMIYWKIIL